ncbi:MAG: ParA family protein [Bacillota bacterium]|jgi:cellulose biosynthesis protein BcsQ|nr:ParA family protein [Bacillota bacterium]
MVRLLIAHNEREYGFALAKAISNIHKGFDVNIVPFQSMLEIESALFSNKCDFLLTDSGFESFDLDRINDPSLLRKTVVLTEAFPELIVNQVKRNDSGHWLIYKYATVSDILNDLNFLYAYLTGKKIVNSYLSTALIGVLGVSGGAGTSTVAIGLARELSRFHDKKIMFLTFEEFPATELVVKFGPGRRRIGDYLYYLFEKNDEEICSHLDGFTTQDNFGVSFFCPSTGKNELCCLSKDDIDYFIKHLTDSSRYDYIVLDLNHGITPETQQLLTYCSRIVMVHKNDPISLHKLRKSIDFLNKREQSFSEEKLLHVSNLNRSEHQLTGNDSTGLEKLIVIDHDENSFSYNGEELDIEISQTFGTGIKQIAQAVLLAETNHCK